MNTNLAQIFQGISTISGWVAFAIILIALHRSGVLASLLSFLKKNGNGTMEHRIQDLESHAEIANREMGEVKRQLTGIETKLDIIMRHLKI